MDASTIQTKLMLLLFLYTSTKTRILFAWTLVQVWLYASTWIKTLLTRPSWFHLSHIFYRLLCAGWWHSLSYSQCGL